MNIFPKVGVDSIKLGMKQREVQAILGAPAAIEKIDDEELWEFDSGLELSFLADNSFRLSSISVMADSVLLDAKPIIGIAESELAQVFPAFRPDEDYKKDGKSYYADAWEIMAWVFDGEVFNLVIFPEYDEQTEQPIWPE